MAAVNYSDATVSKWIERMENEARDLEANMAPDAVPHFGTGNAKTRAVNEGTLPLVTCPGCARKSCGKSCYAFRISMQRPNVRSLYAKNTIIRRRDPVDYYARAFASAYLAGAVLRVNESGDFETPAQLRAYLAAARSFSNVKSIAYTRRDFAFEAAREIPENVKLHYSVFTDVDRVAEVNARGLPAACVSADPSAVTGCVNCPHNSNPDWTCSACASAGVCCSSRNNVCFKLS